MPPSINMTPSEVEESRLQQNKASTKLGTVQFVGVTFNAAPVELFIDGVAGKRLVIPAESAAAYSYVYATFSTTDNLSAGGIGSGVVNRTGTTMTHVANKVAVSYPNGSPLSVVDFTTDDATDSIQVRVTTQTGGKNMFHNVVVTVSIANESRIITS